LFNISSSTNVICQTKLEAAREIEKQNRGRQNQ